MVRYETSYRENQIIIDDIFVSFFCGYIDGDGSIGWQRNIAFEVHKSWLANLTFFNSMVHQLAGADITNTTGITKKGYARLRISKSRVVQFLANKTKELELPVLKRKWKRVIL